MIIVKDAMVMIHLAKISLLEKSCSYFKTVIIPKKVYEEIAAGKNKGNFEVNIIENLLDSKKIVVKKITNDKYLEKAIQFNIQRGEAEAVALYWQERANYLATDDDNVRKKSVLLDIKIIGTPVIILILYKKRIIDKSKFRDGLQELKKIGWFSNSVIDKISMEGEK